MMKILSFLVVSALSFVLFANSSHAEMFSYSFQNPSSDDFKHGTTIDLRKVFSHYMKQKDFHYELTWVSIAASNKKGKAAVSLKVGGTPMDSRMIICASGYKRCDTISTTGIYEGIGVSVDDDLGEGFSLDKPWTLAISGRDSQLVISEIYVEIEKHTKDPDDRPILEDEKRVSVYCPGDTAHYCHFQTIKGFETIKKVYVVAGSRVCGKDTDRPIWNSGDVFSRDGYVVRVFDQESRGADGKLFDGEIVLSGGCSGDFEITFAPSEPRDKPFRKPFEIQRPRPEERDFSYLRGRDHKLPASGIQENTQ